MALLFDFRCQECGELTEGWASSSDTEATIECEHCHGVAKRIISPVRCQLDGTDPSFPGEYDKWAKKREKQIKYEKSRSYYDNGR